MADHRFDPDPDAYEAKPKRSWWSTCLIGCAIISAVIVAIAILIGIWIANNARRWVSDLASEGMRQMIQSSELDQQVKQELIVQTDRVATAFREGRLSNEQARMLIEKLVKSPVMTSLIVTTVERKYFARSGLSDEEKAQGKITVQRYVDGLINKKIPEKSLDEVMPNIADRDGNGGWRLHQQVSDEDLQAFLEAAKQQADAAGIPETPEPFNPAEEVKKMVDEALPES
jgi:hypothetical protein